MREFFLFVKSLLRIIYFVRGVIFGLIGILVIFAFIISELENIPLADAFYFTFITALTVGYGDIVPKTDFGRIISILIAVVGLIIFGLVVSVANRSLHIAVQQDSRDSGGRRGRLDSTGQRKGASDEQP
jgi:hypothetical protein